MKARIRDFYDKASTEYDRAYAGFSGKFITRFESERVLDALDIKQSDLVLDVGTGTGQYASEIAKRGAIVVGMDVSEEMIKLAQYRNRNNGNLHFVVADASHPPFRTQFDKMVGVGLVEYLEKEDLIELARCLRSGGIAIFTGVVNRHGILKPILRKYMSHKGLPYRPIDRSFFDLGAETRVEHYHGFFLVPPSFLKSVRNLLGGRFEQVLYYIAFFLECTPLRALGTSVFVIIRKQDKP